MEEATGDLNWKGMGTMRISRDFVQWFIAEKGRGEGKAITVSDSGNNVLRSFPLCQLSSSDTELIFPVFRLSFSLTNR